MTDDKLIHILARLEIGFRADSARLEALEKDLTKTLHSVRHFGEKHGCADDWITQWHQQWENIEGLLRRIRMRVKEMQDAVVSDASDRFEKALEAWEAFQAEDAKLVGALGEIRVRAGGLNMEARKDWNLLARALEPHLETIHACAQALRIRLELLKKHSKEEVDILVQDILSKLPNPTLADTMDAERFAQEYHKATIELEQERYKFMGLIDIIKGMFLWVETTEERALKNRSLRVDEA